MPGPQYRHGEQLRPYHLARLSLWAGLLGRGAANLSDAVGQAWFGTAAGWEHVGIWVWDLAIIAGHNSKGGGGGGVAKFERAHAPPAMQFQGVCATPDQTMLVTEYMVCLWLCLEAVFG